MDYPDEALRTLKWKIAAVENEEVVQNECFIEDDISLAHTELFKKATVIDHIVDILTNLAAVYMSIDEDGKIVEDYGKVVEDYGYKKVVEDNEEEKKVVEYIKKGELINKFRLKMYNYMRLIRRDIQKLYLFRFEDLKNLDFNETIYYNKGLINDKEKLEIEDILRKYKEAEGDISKVAEVYNVSNNLFDVYLSSEKDQLENNFKLNKNFLLNHYPDLSNDFNNSNEHFIFLYEKIKENAVENIFSVSKTLSEKVENIILKINERDKNND